MMVYEYTKPRGPIAASYTGPGPSYALPGLIGRDRHDPTSRYAKAPAYAFGTKPAQYADERSEGPGPCYMPLAKVYRKGKEVSPSVVLVSSRSEPKLFVTPGPATYSPVEPDKMSRHIRQPAFTMSRAQSESARLAEQTITPGPNAYSPDSMLGRTVRSTKRRAPGYSISSRNSFGGYLSDDCTRTPGPGDYRLPSTDMYKTTKAPGVSLIGRRTMSGNNVTVPGPGAHCPEKVTVTRTRRPAFTFGIRHSQYVVQTPNTNIDSASQSAITE